MRPQAHANAVAAAARAEAYRADHAAGMTIATIAAKHGVHPRTVRRALDRSARPAPREWEARQRALAATPADPILTCSSRSRWRRRRFAAIHGETA